MFPLARMDTLAVLGGYQVQIHVAVLEEILVTLGRVVAVLGVMDST